MRENIYNTRTLTTATSDPKQCFSNFPCIRITRRACRNRLAQVGLGWSQEFAFLTSTKVLLKLLVWGVTL